MSAPVTTVEAQVDTPLAEQASAVLAASGVSLSAVMLVVLKRVVVEGALPLDFMSPNETTVAAMEEARIGSLKSFSSIDDLMADLNADD